MRISKDEIQKLAIDEVIYHRGVRYFKNGAVSNVMWSNKTQTYKATVTGKHDVVALSIDPSIVDPEDIEMLEDLVAAAVNDAITKARAESEEEMGKLTGGLNMPGIF